MEDQEIKPTEGTPEEVSPEGEVSANGFRAEPAGENESQEAREAAASSGELGADEAAPQEEPVVVPAETGQPAPQEATVSADEVTADRAAPREEPVETRADTELPAPQEAVVSAHAVTADEAASLEEPLEAQ